MDCLDKKERNKRKGATTIMKIRRVPAWKGLGVSDAPVDFVEDLIIEILKELRFEK